jgi:hypothetical protein
VTGDHVSALVGIINAGKESLLPVDLVESRLDPVDLRALDRRWRPPVRLLRLLSSLSEISYRSSNSVASVEKLSRVHGADDEPGEVLSLIEDGDEGGIGARIKWFPRGVGK